MFLLQRATLEPGSQIVAYNNKASRVGGGGAIYSDFGDIILHTGAHIITYDNKSAYYNGARIQANCLW